VPGRAALCLAVAASAGGTAAHAGGVAGSGATSPVDVGAFEPPAAFPELPADAAATPGSFAGGPFVFHWPLDRIVITSHFGKRPKPFKKRGKVRGFHGALDLDGDLGEEVHAAGPGRVAHAGWFYGYGNLVVLNHDGGFQTLYGHLSEVHVFIGELVRAGATLGLVGSTGTSTGTHLHFAVAYKGKPIDPAKLIGTWSSDYVDRGDDDDEAETPAPAAAAKGKTATKRDARAPAAKGKPTVRPKAVPAAGAATTTATRILPAPTPAAAGAKAKAP
jgi:hypothetical protein